MILVPCVLETLLRLIFAHRLSSFEQAGAPLLAIFPLMTVFLVTSVALLRERTSGTLERLLTTPLARLELLVGYALAFGLLAMAQAMIASALTLGPLGLHVRGSTAAGRCARRWRRAARHGSRPSGQRVRAQRVPGRSIPAGDILPQLLLCGLLVARERMPGVLHAASDLLPMSYAVDGMHHLTREGSAAGALWGDIAIVLAFAAGALVLGAVTLRRRTA